MKELYHKLSPKAFKNLSIALLILCDLSLFSYIFIKFTDKDTYQKSFDLVLSRVPKAQMSIPQDFGQQLYVLLVNTMLTILSLAFLYHILVYFFWYKKSQLARGYIWLYAWIGGIGCSLTSISLVADFTLSSLLIVVVGLFLLFVAMGLKHFPEEESRKSSQKEEQ